MTTKEFNDKMTDLANKFDSLKRSALEENDADKLANISKELDSITEEKGRIIGMRQQEISGRKIDFATPADIQTNGKAEKRGDALRTFGSSVTRNLSDVYKRAAVTTAQGLIPAHYSNEISQAPFPTVSRLYNSLYFLNLQGGESFDYPYRDGYATADATNEAEDYNESEPTFGHIHIGKEKLTIYCEISEERLKLPSADYEGAVRAEVTKALQRAIVKRVINGSNGFVGILDASNAEGKKIIPVSSDLSIEALDNKTLRRIVLGYGSVEDTEGTETIVLNKEDLNTLGLVTRTTGEFAYQLNSANHTLDLIPYIISNDIPKFSAGAYFGFYGNLSNYIVPVYSPVEIRRSNDYKFKQGRIAIKASVFLGGAPRNYCGLRRLKKSV